MTIFLVCILLAITLIYAVSRNASFGQKPTGARLKRITSSINFKNGSFQNPVPTQVMMPGNTFKILAKLFNSDPKRKPPGPIPVHKNTDWGIQPGLTYITWLGHSSYLLQVDGLNILVDPVFSTRVSPFNWIGSKRFPATENWALDDFPRIDIVLISHDHYDHLDHQFIKQLQYQHTQFYTFLGVGAHLESWGIPATQIHELDLWESVDIAHGFRLDTCPSRHFSGRSFSRNNTLWGSFILQTQHKKLFIGGDSGYSPIFKEMGDKYGSFDIAILECGQYSPYWPDIHMLPHETVQACKDLHANLLLPVHWGKYALGLHTWDEPAELVLAAAAEKDIHLVMPMQGQRFTVENPPLVHTWWREI
ncbi:MBL fold metallo-hydrolase [Chitinophaga caeni]|uniref:MBL fold metallo-hydrolase n=1 Tax=Chitinophaga caeni TaxID=2029983 RepID=A0A291QTE8_9BACT|nr:MBL fold metallo-hydrolase [Chitinophaga caeni]ATL47152.1 MBL fold metallo-hydrolase [Chitinophaga caeni]